MSTNFVPSSSLSELAQQITANATKLDEYINTHNLPKPSFAKDGPVKFPTPESEVEIHTARMQLIEAAKTMYELALGPYDMLFWSSLTLKWEGASLRAINRYKIAQAVPLDGEISFAEIAKIVDLDEDIVTRLIRYCTTSRVFQEHREGYVSHTAASALIAKEKMAQYALNHLLDDVLAPSANLNEALDKFKPYTAAPTETAMNIAFNTDKDWFSYLEEHDDRRIANHETMKVASVSGARSVKHLIGASEIWDKLSSGTIVDVGGSLGHASIALAEVYPNMKFVVQDLPEVVAQGKTGIPEEYKERISYMNHNFMETQPTEADVYLLRFILHDWPDATCVKILKNIVPMMKKSSRIIINDTVLPRANVIPSSFDKLGRAADLQMLVLLNAKERTLRDWEKLVSQADERLSIHNVITPPGAGISTIEVGF